MPGQSRKAMDDGAVKYHEGQEGVAKPIWSSMHDHRFYMAEYAEKYKRNV